MKKWTETRNVVITTRQSVYLSWTTDILIYTVVLNLFVEYVDNAVIDSFTISVLTAVLLKILLDLVLGFEHRVHGFYAAKEGAFFKVAGAVSLFAILFLGKLFILEVVDLVFGDHVELGHLLEVIVLVLALIISRELLHRFYVWLGDPDAPPETSLVSDE
ncbi:MAG: hypothetical protein ACR2NG_07900 [Acidimicrobiia bacterium]